VQLGEAETKLTPWYPPLCTTDPYRRSVVYRSRQTTFHHALPVALTTGGEGYVALRAPSSSVKLQQHPTRDRRDQVPITTDTMQQENERMKLKDGRTLSYSVYGSQ
jgi:hypothetical protein